MTKLPLITAEIEMFASQGVPDQVWEGTAVRVQQQAIQDKGRSECWHSHDELVPELSVQEHNEGDPVRLHVNRQQGEGDALLIGCAVTHTTIHTLPSPGML